MKPLAFLKNPIWLERLLTLVILICLALPFVSLYDFLNKREVFFFGYKVLIYPVFTMAFINAGIILLLSLLFAKKFKRLYAIIGFILAVSAMVSAFGDTLFEFDLISRVGPIIPEQPETIKFWFGGRIKEMGQQLVQICWVIIMYRFTWSLHKTFKGSVVLVGMFLSIAIIALFLPFLYITKGILYDFKKTLVQGIQTLSIITIGLAIITFILGVYSQLINKNNKDQYIYGLITTLIACGLLFIDKSFTILASSKARIGWALAISGWSFTLSWYIWHLLRIRREKSLAKTAGTNQTEDI